MKTNKFICWLFAMAAGCTRYVSAIKYSLREASWQIKAVNCHKVIMRMRLIFWTLLVHFSIFCTGLCIIVYYTPSNLAYVPTFYLASFLLLWFAWQLIFAMRMSVGEELIQKTRKIFVYSNPIGMVYWLVCLVWNSFTWTQRLSRDLVFAKQVFRRRMGEELRRR